MREKLKAFWDWCGMPLLQACLLTLIFGWIAFVPYEYIKHHSLWAWVIPAVYGATFVSVTKLLAKLLEVINGRPKI
jgi:hypothetical protein